MSDDSASRNRQPNHLLGQTSPYLLQHLYNPVDWYAWGPEALERARSEDKPIFISIGYAACHWCHVMERESFENPQIAERLNRSFVSIKVDREERPDLDEIYMNAVQLMTRSGGWPLNMFLTPDLRPFMGGTYFPPEPGYGRISFGELLERIHEAWTTRRDEIERSAGELFEHLDRIASGEAGASDGARIGRSESARAAGELTQRFDGALGGFGAAPKFPPDGALALLLREQQRSGECVPLEMVERTLDAMALGGMYDHIGGGFARYSVDAEWLVPHFEKMLYNQALLVPVYTDAWLITSNPLYRRVVEETLDFVRAELTHETGGFFSSLDADSEGVEGRFYVWTPAEIELELGAEDAALFSEIYGVSAGGNFEGSNIPNLLGGSLARQAEGRDVDEATLAAQLLPLRQCLLAARGRRTRPATDDKVLTAWNGLMISAFCRGYQACGRDADLESACRAATFVLDNLMRDDRLLVSWREGQAQLNGYLDDHAFLARGLVDLYESCFDPAWLRAAEKIADTMLLHFEDPERGGFFFTSDDHEAILTRNRSLHDGALPAGAGVAAEVLIRLAVHVDRPELRAAAERALVACKPAVARAASAYASLIAASDLADGPIVEIAIAGSPDDPRTRKLLDAVRSRYLPRRVVALARPGDEDGLPLLRGKSESNGAPTAYVCRDYACQAPTVDPDELARTIDGASRG